MIAKDIINYMIPPLKPSDKAKKAREWMSELRVTELPVIADGQFLGFIDEEMLLEDGITWENVGDFPLLGQQCFIDERVHYYDVLKVANAEGYKVIAVLDSENKYIGAISIQDIVEVFAKSSSVNLPGAILGIALTISDYSLAEISYIVESNDAKILSSFLSPENNNPSNYFLTLKVNVEDVTHIVASLQNRGFNVETSFNTTDDQQSDLDRIDMLMKYIKI
ncbi:MAG: acetoin utilization protein AcuB [Cyclobacteriaceae bacterium]|jgi:acetoin utilization protein AcuB